MKSLSTDITYRFLILVFESLCYSPIEKKSICIDSEGKLTFYVLFLRKETRKIFKFPVTINEETVSIVSKFRCWICWFSPFSFHFSIELIISSKHRFPNFFVSWTTCHISRFWVDPAVYLELIFYKCIKFQFVFDSWYSATHTHTLKSHISSVSNIQSVSFCLLGYRYFSSKTE